MRPDGMLQADTPVRDRIRSSGAHTLSARTVMPYIMLPCHASLFLGVRPARHGITTNFWAPPARPVPGLFDVLQNAGFVTAFFYNWEQLRDISCPGSLNASFMLKNCKKDSTFDTAVSQLAATLLQNQPFNFTFIYLVGTEQDEDMTILLIMASPAIPVSVIIQQSVQITDIAPTIAHCFGITALPTGSANRFRLNRYRRMVESDQPGARSGGAVHMESQNQDISQV